MAKAIKTINWGDRVNFDFSGKLDNVPFAGGTAKGYTLVIGSGQFIDGFESNMIGMEQGESKTIEVVFPEDYHEGSLAGKLTTFDLKINSIKKGTIK